MIRAMFDAPAIEADLRNPMFERSEGNPFVLEEMLKEAIERGDIVRTDAGWERRSLGDLEIPETVRETILLRLQRLDEEHTTILQAAAVLGRSFDYPTLVAVSGADEGAVNGALEAAIGQQLIEDHPDARGSYRWRHALTQEAIYTDMVMPRRQQLHSRAADALTAQPSMRSIDVAHHLLGAARFAEAVPVCLRSADEAERALAYADAVAVLERALPHVTDPLERARVLCAVGRLTWFNGQPVAAAQFLIDGVEGLESLGERVEAARFGSTSAAATGSRRAPISPTWSSRRRGACWRKSGLRPIWQRRTCASRGCGSSSSTTRAAWRLRLGGWRWPRRQTPTSSAPGHTPFWHWG